jgi:hypothetical protein
MTALSLPALDGRSPLGFLAALGVLRLLTENGHPHARLAWSTRHCTAELHHSHRDLDDLAADLQAIVETIPEGGVLPSVPADFPPLGEAPDKLRLPRPQFRDYADSLQLNNDEATFAQIERWLSSLVTDLSIDDKGRADISLFTAPAGKQSMRTMLTKPLTTVRDNPATLAEALRGWRRYPGTTGEYLDHRALFDAADAPDGKPAMRGVPGATWLALMSYPLLITTSAGNDQVSSGWQRNRGRQGGPRLLYPLWSTPVDTYGALALLSHPALQGSEPGTPSAAFRTATVFLICAATRLKADGQKSAGVLIPISPEPPQRQALRSRPTTPRHPAGPAII